MYNRPETGAALIAHGETLSTPYIRDQDADNGMLHALVCLSNTELTYGHGELLCCHLCEPVNRPFPGLCGICKLHVVILRPCLQYAFPHSSSWNAVDLNDR
jgi:hypothetical protein